MTASDASKRPGPAPEENLPVHHNPLPELSETSSTPPRTITPENYIRVQNSAEFAELRSTFRKFSFPLTAVFLVWYFTYVLLSVFAHDFMSTDIGMGNLNLGHLLGLLQFITTFLITWLYIRHANRRLDPLAGRIRADLEGAAS